MAKLIVLCGPAFSGKTSFALALQDELSFTIVSADWIMAETKPMPPYFVEDWQAVHEAVLLRTRSLLDSGRDVAIDDTACFRFLRDHYRALASEVGASVRLVVLKLDSDEVWKRARANRLAASRYDVEDEIIENHLRTFEWPDLDEEPLTLDANEPIGEHLKRLKVALKG